MPTFFTRFNRRWHTEPKISWLILGVIAWPLCLILVNVVAIGIALADDPAPRPATGPTKH